MIRGLILAVMIFFVAALPAQAHDIVWIERGSSALTKAAEAIIYPFQGADDIAAQNAYLFERSKKAKKVNWHRAESFNLAFNSGDTKEKRASDVKRYADLYVVPYINEYSVQTDISPKSTFTVTTEEEYEYKSPISTHTSPKIKKTQQVTIPEQDVKLKCVEVDFWVYDAKSGEPVMVLSSRRKGYGFTLKKGLQDAADDFYAAFNDALKWKSKN